MKKIPVKPYRPNHMPIVQRNVAAHFGSGDQKPSRPEKRARRKPR